MNCIKCNRKLNYKNRYVIMKVNLEDNKMVRSYTKSILLEYKEKALKKLAVSDELGLKLSEALIAIQEKGGTIINSTLVPFGFGSQLNAFFYVVYEDNGKNDEIYSYLRDEIFNFISIKLL